ATGISMPVIAHAAAQNSDPSAQRRTRNTIFRRAGVNGLVENSMKSELAPDMADSPSQKGRGTIHDQPVDCHSESAPNGRSCGALAGERQVVEHEIDEPDTKKDPLQR